MSENSNAGKWRRVWRHVGQVRVAPIHVPSVKAMKEFVDAQAAYDDSKGRYEPKTLHEAHARMKVLQQILHQLAITPCMTIDEAAHLPGDQEAPVETLALLDFVTDELHEAQGQHERFVGEGPPVPREWFMPAKQIDALKKLESHLAGSSKGDGDVDKN